MWVLVFRIGHHLTIGPVFVWQGSSISWWISPACSHGRRLALPFFRNLADRALVPAKDPYFKEAMAHGGH